MDAHNLFGFNRFWALFALLGMTCSLCAAAPGGVDFQRKVRPILSDACFLCHGPDKSTRVMGLRLDTHEGAFSERKTGKVIVPGNAKASLLYQRISHSNPALRMPPAYTKKTLTAEQIEILRKWIDEGAEWKEHWSFQAPAKRELPAVAAKGWVRNPIDNFILARLESMGLKPAPEADRRTLIRRVSLDLTGLPPDPADVEAFVRDRAPNAYERLVDRLLGSRQWGEHRARYWLDAARYADTHGLHIDNYREMWPYRDWVIQAFNRNLPFDRFTIEQLAGDMLPNATLDDRIASGFHRCNITTNEGGVIPEEVDAMYQKDRVETTSAVWLGLTLGCATCHDHKFDPLAQKEFYQMTAFFRNTLQKPLDGNIPDTPPAVVVPRAADRALWASLQERYAELTARKARRKDEAGAAFDQWLNTGEYRGWKEPASAEPVVNLNSGAFRMDWNVEWAKSAGRGERALDFVGRGGATAPDVPLFEPSEPFTVSAWVQLPEDGSMVVASHTDSKNQSKGWVFDIGGRIPHFALMDSTVVPRLQRRAGNAEPLPAKGWNHVAVTYDGSKEEAGITFYWNGAPMAAERVAADPEEESKPADPKRIAFRIGSDGRRFTKGAGIADLRVYRGALNADAVRLLAEWDSLRRAIARPVLPESSRDGLMLLYLNRKDEAYRNIAAQLSELEQQRRAVRRRGAETLVMREKTDGKPMAHILFRGQYDQPRDLVYANVPSVLPPMSKNMPHNRLGLAEWLMDPANPLTARVTVNRFWQEIFGTGIVKTAEDFGSQGEAPVNQDLLDWMALHFRDSGWDVKAFYKLMVTSAAYRQSAKASPEALKKDPENRYLSRGPRFRMDAEMVRDYALAAGGLLAKEIGGPSVKPYQPKGVWEAVAMKSSTTRFYHQDHGDNLYRRSLYTFWKRSAPPASMEIFNAPSRENCTVRRERTNTPLQALVTMNDVQFVEAARALAGRALENAPAFDSRLDYLTMRALARPFEARERAVARSAYDDFLTYYQANAGEARKLTGTGESKPDSGLAPAELAAWTMMANDVLNLDEALNK